MRSLSMTAPAEVLVRWMVSDDIGLLPGLARDGDFPQWTCEDFRENLRSVDTIGKVAEINERVVGFLMYRLDDENAEVIIENFAVARAWRRHGIATCLLGSLARKLLQGYTRIVALVPDSNLPAQLLLRGCGFRAMQVLRRSYGDNDAYRMERDTFAPAICAK